MDGHIEKRANFFKVGVSIGTGIGLSLEGTSTRGVEVVPHQYSPPLQIIAHLELQIETHFLRLGQA